MPFVKPPTVNDSAMAPEPEEGGHLLGQLLRFGQLLRVMGVDVSTGQVLDLVEALKHVPISNRFDFYHACQALLVNRREDFYIFNQAFQLFWRDEVAPAENHAAESSSTLKRVRLPHKIASQQESGPDPMNQDVGKPGEDEEGEEKSERKGMMVYSPDEMLRTKDFAEMTWEEIQEAKRAIAALQWDLGERRTRRMRSSSKGRINMRRLVRDNLRYGGEPVHLAHRRRVTQPRPLVILSDISGSMERYSRMLLHFVHALTHGLTDIPVETFVFGTRLTRITRHLRYKDVDESLDELGRSVTDWSGGTRIGEALKAFNFDWARRVLGQGGVVLVISDGWDRGELALLRQEILRLQRSAYRLIWLNPYMGSHEYEPVQRGIATVMPCVDDFLPVNNLASLEQLAEELSRISDVRPVRKQRTCEPRVYEPPRKEGESERRTPTWDKDWEERVNRNLNFRYAPLA